MFYKVMKDGKVIDVLDKLVYLKYQPKHQIMVLCDINEAQAILSSDGDTIWHEKTLYKIPNGEYETVELKEIDEVSYKQLKIFGLKSIEDVLDEYTAMLLAEGVI